MFPRQYVQVYSRLFQYFKVKEAKYDFLYVIFDIFEEKLRMALANDWKKISRLSMYGCFLWMVVCSFFLPLYVMSLALAHFVPGILGEGGRGPE